MAAQVQTTPDAPSAIPVRSIRVGTNNPRKHFDPAAHAELTASVRDKGVLLPIIVRPAPPSKDGAVYELVAGERRLRAAREAGLETIPAVVRTLTDTEAFEIAFIENVQRRDLEPLDEAHGYEKLQSVHRYTLEDVALKVAKSKGYVLARLKLLGLPEPAKKALSDGTLQLSTALLIARIPNQKLAGEATSAVLGLGRGAHDGPMSHVRAAKFIRENYMLSLRGAPFPTADATLVPEAGACATCPKRTGNQRDLFGDVERDDVCLLRGIWRRVKGTTGAPRSTSSRRGLWAVWETGRPFGRFSKSLWAARRCAVQGVVDGGRLPSTTPAGSAPSTAPFEAGPSPGEGCGERGAGPWSSKEPGVPGSLARPGFKWLLSRA